MATEIDVYVDLNGREVSLTHLDQEEQKLIDALRSRAEGNSDWVAFDNFWMNAVGQLYDARGMSRSQARRSVVFRIAQDLSGRLAIASGMARASDYRDELEELSRTRFRTRREFCNATGLSEDMLSHVLARRKHLSIETLLQALQRIGYEIRIVPHHGSGTTNHSNGEKHSQK